MPSNPDDSNLPPNTAFTQQRLPASQPQLTACNVIGTFLAVGVSFIGLGVALLLASNSVREYTLDYTDCLDSTGTKCADKVNPLTSQMPFPTCQCTVPFKVDEDIPQPVYFYYKMTNYNQNHFAYQRSVDYAQLSGHTSGLAGNTLDSETLGQFCTPKQNNITVNGVVTDELGTVAPCGAIANTLFNDSFTSGDFIFDKTDLAWNTDHEIKFNNPDSGAAGCEPDSTSSSNLSPCFDSTEYPQAQPEFWKFDISNVAQITNPAGGAANNDENGYKNQQFEVWMRVGAFSTLYKLFAVVKHDISARNAEYNIDVMYNYPVNGLGVEKSIVVSTMSWAGGKNPFLGIAYITVGSLSLLAAIFLFYTYKRTGNKFHM